MAKSEIIQNQRADWRGKAFLWLLPLLLFFALSAFSSQYVIAFALVVAVLCIGWLVFPGTLPESVGDLFMYLIEDVIVFTLIDCLRLFIIGLVTAKLLAGREAARKEYNRKANILGNEMQSARSIAFPFAKFVSFKNPVHVGLAVMALIYWLTFYIQYVYYDIVTLIKLEYLHGMSLQLVNLLVNAVLAAICYCVAAFVLIKLDEKMPKTE